MLELLKESVLKANLLLQEYGLATFSWGNASAIDRDSGLVVIKPSGVPNNELKTELLVVIDLEGNRVEGILNPSSDTATHLVLYKAFPEIGGIVHSHTVWSTLWAQAGMAIPAMGTTHADYFYGSIPCTRPLTEAEINGKYEEETGNVIVEAFKGLDPMRMPGVIVNRHGPFNWGKDLSYAVYNAVVMENVAMMAYHTCSLLTMNSMSFNRKFKSIDKCLLDRHFFRKHGKDAYYGQEKKRGEKD